LLDLSYRVFFIAENLLVHPAFYWNTRIHGGSGTLTPASKYREEKILLYSKLCGSGCLVAFFYLFFNGHKMSRQCFANAQLILLNAGTISPVFLSTLFRLYLATRAGWLLFRVGGCS
jgi:hypothetical protein